MIYMHGTHVTGVVTSVAPGASWSACRACDSNGCSKSSLLACAQYMTCAHDTRGNVPSDCSKSPNIIVNAWGHPGGQLWFKDVINAWNAAGIIPFFAVGNYGPTCGTAESPSDYSGVISVGSSDVNDAVSSFSARGPKRISDGDVVPLIVAPGENINSAYHYSDNSYQIMSGTSMSVPLVAGAASLLLSKNRGLTSKQMGYILFSTANKNLRRSGSYCGNIAETNYPNNVAGYGRLNIWQAYNRLFGG